MPGVDFKKRQFHLKPGLTLVSHRPRGKGTVSLKTDRTALYRFRDWLQWLKAGTVLKLARRSQTTSV